MSNDKLAPIDTSSPNWKWCIHILDETSRSFAAVIDALHPTLGPAVGLFYLVLRALDTIEDDTSYDPKKKFYYLENFHTYLDKTGWKFPDKLKMAKPKEQELLDHYDRVIECYQQLKPGYQDAIKKSCAEMGAGMKEFCTREVVTLDDWNLYCYYVAGLVGTGLSGLFASSGLENPEFHTWRDLSISMGLMLQKTNIIRDYLEDLIDQRIFWPREVWSKYAHKLEDFRDAQNKKAALACLNELVTNALGHLGDCFEYMSRIQHPTVLNFCAIPQVMAIGTLCAVYNNYEVFQGVVKMSKEEALNVIGGLNGTFTSMLPLYQSYVDQIRKKVPKDDPNAAKITKILDDADKLIKDRATKSKL